MTIKRDMIKTASRAKELLGDSLNLVINYVKGCQNSDGGFRGRSVESDIYYTVFANNILSAFKETPIHSLNGFLMSRNIGSDSDFVDICSYINLLSSIEKKESLSEEKKARLQNMLELYRSADGGYSVYKNASHGSAYGCFLAYSTYENLGLYPQRQEMMLNCLERLSAVDGGYSNEPEQKEGVTTATAAAIVLLQKLNGKIPQKTIDWILARFHKSGGFLATPSTAIPDLLSTATALFALKSINYDLSEIKESCLDFLDSVWDGNGAFRGHWFDEQTDVEYTFYGLLSIGCISG